MIFKKSTCVWVFSVCAAAEWLVTIQRRSATWQGGQSRRGGGWKGEAKGGGERRGRLTCLHSLFLCLCRLPIHSLAPLLFLSAVCHSVALLLHSSSCLLGHLSPLPSPPPSLLFLITLSSALPFPPTVAIAPLIFSSITLPFVSPC